MYANVIPPPTTNNYSHSGRQDVLSDPPPLPDNFVRSVYVININRDPPDPPDPCFKDFAKFVYVINIYYYPPIYQTHVLKISRDLFQRILED